MSVADHLFIEHLITDKSILKPLIDDFDGNSGSLAILSTIRNGSVYLLPRSPNDQPTLIGNSTTANSCYTFLYCVGKNNEGEPIFRLADGIDHFKITSQLFDLDYNLQMYVCGIDINKKSLPRDPLSYYAYYDTNQCLIRVNENSGRKYDLEIFNTKSTSYPYSNGERVFIDKENSLFLPFVAVQQHTLKRLELDRLEGHIKDQRAKYSSYLAKDYINSLRLPFSAELARRQVLSKDSRTSKLIEKSSTKTHLFLNEMVTIGKHRKRSHRFLCCPNNKSHEVSWRKKSKREPEPRVTCKACLSIMNSLKRSYEKREEKKRSILYNYPTKISA